MKPLIGITADNRDNSADSGRYESPLSYSRAVVRAGGVPIILPHEPELASAMLERLDGLVLTGGVDPRTEAFGEPTHPKARPMDPTRQAFELALLEALDTDAFHAMPTLGVCLGFQLMALYHGGTLHQHLPEDLGDHAVAKTHQDDATHGLAWETGVADSPLHDLPETDRRASPAVVSWHKQAVRAPGRLRVLAKSTPGTGGLIEAAYLPGRGYYVGVQWHPERATDDLPGSVNLGLYRRLVAAACDAAASRGRS